MTSDCAFKADETFGGKRLDRGASRSAVYKCTETRTMKGEKQKRIGNQSLGLRLLLLAGHVNWK